MAKIVEDVLIIKFSKIVKDSADDPLVLVNESVQTTLEQVVQELVGENVVVEVIKA